MKRGLVLLCLASCLILFAGCGHEKNSIEESVPHSVTESRRAEPVVISSGKDTELHPYEGSGNINSLTFSTLFRRNENTFEPEPCLVYSYDNLTPFEWRFALKKGVKFHNNETLTSRDVKATMEYMRLFPDGKDLCDFCESVDIIDEYSFIITTKEPCGTIPYKLCHWKILPSELINGGHDFGREPIGTGPYRFVRRNPDGTVEFRAFEDYFEGPPHIKEILWQKGGDSQSDLYDLQAERTDYIEDINEEDLYRLGDCEEFRSRRSDSGKFCFIALNNIRRPFDNVFFRRALNCASDKEAAAQAAEGGKGRGAYSSVPPIFADISGRGQDYDAEKAAEYLKKSGIDPALAGFTCLCPGKGEKRAAETVGAGLGELGIHMNTELVTYEYCLGAAETGEYDAILWSWDGDDPVSFLEDMYFSENKGSPNLSRFSDDEIDGLIEIASSSLDESEKKAVLKRCVLRLDSLCPVIPLYQCGRISVYDSNLTNVKPDPWGTVLWHRVSTGN